MDPQWERVGEASDLVSSGYRYLLRERFMSWSGPGAICGYKIWGEIADDDVHAVLDTMEVLLEAEGDVRLLAECSELHGIGQASLVCLANRLRAWAGRFERSRARQAVVYPEGMVGTVVAGFYAVFEPPFSFELFRHRAPALAWLGARDTEVGRLDILFELAESARSVAPIVSSVRNWLTGVGPATAKIEDCARALALSRRTLQRQLRRARTTFRKEAAYERLRRARELLSEDDAKIASVAAALGFSSPQHLSRWFRKETGIAPAAFRQMELRAWRPTHSSS